MSCPISPRRSAPGHGGGGVALARIRLARRNEMRRAGVLLALTLGAALLAESTAAARPAHPAFGVFATINGKRYKAPATGKPDDRCVNGTYMASGGVVFSALECHGRGHRRRSRKHLKVLAIAC